MCQLQVLFMKDKKDSLVLPVLMNAISYAAFQKNDDGEGYIALNNKAFTSFKSKGKLIYKEPCYLLATHQRFGTSGENDFNNAHPHTNEGLYIMHNGILSGGTKEKCDTAIITEKLGEVYKANKYDLIKSIKEVFDKLDGSFSIVLYEERTGKVYYFKNDRTNMFIAQNSKVLIMSTEQVNVEYALLFLNMKKEVKAVDDYIVYDVIDEMKEVGKLEKVEYVWKGWAGYGGYDIGGGYSYPLEVSNKAHRKSCVVCHGKGYNMKKCHVCKDYAHDYCADIYIYNKKPICEFCTLNMISVHCSQCNQKLDQGELRELLDIIAVQMGEVGINALNVNELICGKCQMTDINVKPN